MDRNEDEYSKDYDRLRLIRQMNERAIGLFIDDFVRQFRGYLIGKVQKPREAALEYAHQVVVILVLKEDVKLTSGLMTFAISIAKYIQSNEYRQRKRHPTIALSPRLLDELAVAEDNIYTYVEQSYLHLLIEECLLQLPEKCQKILRLVMAEETVSSATLKLGYSSNSIFSVRRSECLGKMKDKIRKSPDFNTLINN